MNIDRETVAGTRSSYNRSKRDATGYDHREFREYDRIFSLGEGGEIERILRREREEHVTDVLKWKINSWEPFSVISVILYGLWTRVGVLQ